MFAISLLLLPICMAKDLPETKHLRGGIFSWPNALASNRKIWSSLKVPKISFNSGDISLSDLTKEIISGQLDLNLSEIIQDMLGSIFNETKEEDNSEEIDNLIEQATTFIHKLQPRKNRKTIRDNQDYDYIEGEESETQNKCDENLYPNAHLMGDMFGEDLDCQTVNDLLGQLLSYVFVIAPLLVLFILSLLFYLVFCFGRCCCCKAKEKTNPGIVSIVFFGVITTFMVITIAFSFTASGYLVKVINYVFKNNLQKEVEAVCEMIDPSLSEGLQGTVDKLVPSIENISIETVNTIDLSLPQVMRILDNTQNNLTDLLNFMKGIGTSTQDSRNKAKTKEDEFNTCKTSNPNGNSNCDLENINLIGTIYKGDEIEAVSKELDSALANISDIMNITSFIDSGKDTIVDSISGIKDSVSELGNVSVFNKCDLSDTFSFVKDIPSFVVPVSGFVLFLMPIIMTVTLAFQAFSFWTKNCCSRCCSLCCIPCCICSFCQLFIGLMATVACIAVIFVNLFYQQGDDVFDTFIKEITSEDRVIDFGSMNLSSFSDNVIGYFPLEKIQLRKIEFVKNFIDAKLDTPFSQIISLNQMPFDEIADMLEHSLNNAANSTNVNDLIVYPLRDLINETSASLPDFNLAEIANMSEMTEQINQLETVVDSCYSSCSGKFDDLSNAYKSFKNDFTGQIDNFKTKRENVDVVLKDVPNQVSIFAHDLFGGLLRTFGKSLASTFRTIAPAFNDLDMKWLIGGFNIIRVRFMYNILTATLFMSVVSHLYIVGMVAMSILLWIRHKGMAKNGSDNSSSEESLSDSNEEEEENNNQQQQQQQPPQQTLTVQPAPQVQRRSIIPKRKQQVDNAPDDEYSLNSSSIKTKSSSKKQKVENDNSDSEQQPPSDSVNEIVDNDEGINFSDANDPENPNNDNFINPYNLSVGEKSSDGTRNNAELSSSDDNEPETTTREVQDQQQPNDQEEQNSQLEPIEPSSVLNSTFAPVEPEPADRESTNQGDEPVEPIEPTPEPNSIFAPVEPEPVDRESTNQGDEPVEPVEPTPELNGLFAPVEPEPVDRESTNQGDEPVEPVEPTPALNGLFAPVEPEPVDRESTNQGDEPIEEEREPSDREEAPKPLIIGESESSDTEKSLKSLSEEEREPSDREEAIRSLFVGEPE